VHRPIIFVNDSIGWKGAFSTSSVSSSHLLRINPIEYIPYKKENIHSLLCLSTRFCQKDLPIYLLLINGHFCHQGLPINLIFGDKMETSGPLHKTLNELYKNLIIEEHRYQLFQMGRGDYGFLASLLLSRFVVSSADIHTKWFRLKMSSTPSFVLIIQLDGKLLPPHLLSEFSNLLKNNPIEYRSEKKESCHFFLCLNGHL
jgi:hypothetical protein